MKKNKLVFVTVLSLVLLCSVAFMACGNKKATSYHTVTFTGEGVTEFSVQIEDGKHVEKPNDPPPRIEYDFLGWYYNDAPYEFSSPVTSDITLTAKWEKKQGETSDSFEKDGLIYSVLGDNTLKVSAQTDYSYANKTVIPATVENMSVTVIGDMSSITAKELILPDSITKIDDNAFKNNKNIQIVDMGKAAASIGKNAFENTPLYVIELGQTTAIGADAFVNTRLHTVSIPSSVISIDDNAFNCKTIEEIGIAENFPQLGKLVFGTGERNNNERLYIYASLNAWNSLTENAAGNTEEEKITSATGLTRLSRHILDSDTLAASIGSSKIYRGENITVYVGMGTETVIFTNRVQFSELPGDYTHTYYFNTPIPSSLNDRQTIKLNSSDASAEILAKNANGEVIKDGVLYDYTGTELVYTTPDDVHTVAAYAASNNEAIRFVKFGDSVKNIKAFAFSYGNIFGLEFGAELTEIGEYAFFGQQYLLEAVFNGDEPPAIGTGAFCYISTAAFVPTFYFNSMANFGMQPKIYSKYSSWSWGDEPACQPFIDAFNTSLSEIDEDLIAKDDNDNPVTYSSSQFSQIVTYGLFAKGTTYETDFGTITSSGTESGYNTVEFKQDSGYADSGYVYISKIPGYNGDNDPKKAEVFFGTDIHGYAQSFVTYGTFDSNTKKFIPRGEEAGSYGDIESEIIKLDGYGNVSYIKSDKTAIGTYQITGNTITIIGIDGIASAVYNSQNKTLSLGNKTLETLGEEAGIYYDKSNRATIKLDGKPWEDNIDDKTTVHYNGKLTFTYKGSSLTVGYSFKNSNAIIFMLNDREKEWTYSRTADYVIQGYYGNYTEQLTFCIVEPTLVGTYKNGNDSLMFDGYYTATMGQEEYGYYIFGTSDSILLYNDSECKIIYLNKADNTYSEASNYAGKYHVTASENYSLYLDGKGNILYYDGTFKLGTYEYDATTQAIKTRIGNDTETEDGFFDAENGLGYLVYYASGNTYLGISKQPFTTIATYVYVRYYYIDNDNSVTSSAPSFNIFESGNTLFITSSGKPLQLIPLDTELNDGTTVEIQYKINDTASVTIEFTISKTDSGYTVTGRMKNSEIIKIQDKTYTFCWLNSEKSYIGIIENGSFGGSTIAKGEVIWKGDTKFTVGNCTVDGYGTDSVTVTIEEESGN